LEAKTDLVDCMLEQMTEMEENIKRAKKGDFKVVLHRMEVIQKFSTEYLFKLTMDFPCLMLVM
jgi:hypothetical protein